MSRTKIDFSGHVLKETKYDGVLIHEFKIPGTVRNGFTFINSNDAMAVTGDFGNWIFCREFHPSADAEKISDSYWNEKLRMKSQQTAGEFDTESTIEAIEEFKKNFEEDHDREMSEDELSWIEDLEQHVFDKIEYEYYAYREKPSSIEYEDVPYGKVEHRHLLAVYDAFEAICAYMKLQEEAKSTDHGEFFIDEKFYSDGIDELYEDVLADYEAEEEIPEDWEERIEYASLQKMLALTPDFVVDAIFDATEDMQEERMPEDFDIQEIKSAIRKGIDVDKMNEAMPKLYYPNGEFRTLTKSDLLNK